MDIARKERLTIIFHSEEDIIAFVDTCNRYDDAIDIQVDKMSMDAKSILGMLKMKIEQPLEILYGCYDDEDNYEEFKEDVLEHFDAQIAPVKKVIDPEIGQKIE